MTLQRLVTFLICSLSIVENYAVIDISKAVYPQSVCCVNVKIFILIFTFYNITIDLTQTKHLYCISLDIQYLFWKYLTCSLNIRFQEKTR